jgi:hypothetical protein
LAPWDAWMVAFEPGDRDKLNGTSATNIWSLEMAPTSLTAAARGGRVTATSYRPSYDVIKGFRGSQSHHESDGQLGKVNCRQRRAQHRGFQRASVNRNGSILSSLGFLPRFPEARQSRRQGAPPGPLQRAQGGHHRWRPAELRRGPAAGLRG